MKKLFNSNVFFQILYVVLLVVVMVFLTYKNKPEDISLSEISEAFEDRYIYEGITKMDALKVKKSFGINVADYNEFVYYASTDTMNVDELLIIKMKDENQKSNVVDYMQERIDKQKKVFNGYGTDQINRLNSSRIFSSGNYICLIVSDKTEEWLGLIKDKLKVR